MSAKDGGAVDGDTLRGKTEAVFRDIDTDGSGTIDLEELKSAVEKFGLELSDETIGSMMSEVRQVGILRSVAWSAWVQSAVCNSDQHIS